MADSRDAPASYALIDLAAVVISPALVMMMVGSFVYFLVDTIYPGAYRYRLYWCLGFFVFGAVLIARLSIQTSRKYAALYAAGLGFACFLAMMQYVQYPPGILNAVAPVVNLALMAFVWLVADKLTWDCTHLDEDQKASGRGILAATGLDDAAKPEAEDEPEDLPAGGKKKKKREDEGFLGWVERYKAFRKEQKKKPHTPGTWVLYFGLGALPIFALGQSLIPADDSTRRTAVFVDMALYVGSALGLLVTTTLFGLRKYLVQRNAKVPPVLAASWLGLGGGLIVVFLLVGAILPRPHSETPLVEIGRGKGNREASRYAVVRDKDAGKGKGAAGQKAVKGDGKGSGKGGEPGGKSGEKGGGGGKGESQGGNQKGDSKGSQSGDKSGQQNDQSQGKQGQGKESQSKGGKDDSQSKGDQKGDDNKSDSGDQEQDAQNDDSSSDSTDSTSSSFSKLSQVMDGISDFIKWVVWIALAIAVVVGIVIFFLRYFAPFTKWAKGLLDWLRGLFGPKLGGPAAEADVAVEKAERRMPSFIEFTNPFADGSAGSRNPTELAEYTFAAFDAWAWDRDRGRQPEETPLEFAVRVGHEYPALDEPGYKAAEVIARVMYSRKPLPTDTRKTLADLWDQMEATQARR